MNLCVLAGRIVRKASVKGVDRKVLRFTVETRDGHETGATRRIPSIKCTRRAYFQKEGPGLLLVDHRDQVNRPAFSL